ncbi:MAG: hypothetical protein ACRDQH_15110 [Pseudonocardiaceae bacterium]
MIWLTWRQHRVQTLLGVGVLALLAAFLLVSERQMSGYLHSSGLSACLGRHGSCDTLSQLFENRYGTLLNTVAYLNLLPLLAGLFWGAPLIARELEDGTDLLAFTQTVSRRRWLCVKLGFFLALALAAAAVFSLLFGWWFHPFAQLAFHGGQSRIQPNIFDVQGLVPVGYTLFAFALGAAAGALITRTLPAMAVTIAGFAAARFGIQAVRGHLLAPRQAVHSLVNAAGGYSLGSPQVDPRNWVIDSSVIDSAGHRVSDTTVLQTCGRLGNPPAVARCITAHGYQQRDTYQPLTRYWPLQGIEFGIYTAATLVLLAVTVWAVTRHRG